MRRTLALAVIATALLVVACSNPHQPAGLAPAARRSDKSETFDGLRSLGYVTGGTGPGSPAAAPPPREAVAAVWAQRKLIRTATVAVEVEDVPRAVAEVARTATAVGGFVAGSDVRRAANERQHAEITVHVPAARFDEAMTAFGRLGQVRTQRVAAEDVTKEYADLELRLGVKRQAAQRLHALLENRTARLSDVLEVERELDRVVTAIEQLEGERRYYDQQVALSAITLDLDPSVAPGERGPLAPVRAGLGESWRVLASSARTLAYAMAFTLPWLALTALCWTVLRVARRQRRA